MKRKKSYDQATKKRKQVNFYFQCFTKNLKSPLCIELAHCIEFFPNYISKQGELKLIIDIIYLTFTHWSNE